MEADVARRSARQVGLITLPIGVALLAAPVRAGRLLHLGEHPAALRVIAVLDLALVPGLVAGRRRWQWLTVRAVLNVGIAAYCLRLTRREQAPGAVVAAAAMLVATVADARVVTALRHEARATGNP